MISDGDLAVLRFTGQLQSGDDGFPVPETQDIRDIRAAAARLVQTDDMWVEFNPPGPVRARILELIEQECVRVASLHLPLAVTVRELTREEKNTRKELKRAVRCLEKMRLSWWAWRGEWQIRMGMSETDPIQLIQRELASMRLPDVTLDSLRNNGVELGNWPLTYFNNFEVQDTPLPGFIEHPRLPRSNVVGLIFHHGLHGFFRDDEWFDYLKMFRLHFR